MSRDEDFLLRQVHCESHVDSMVGRGHEPRFVNRSHTVAPMSTTGQKMRRRIAAGTSVVVLGLTALGIYLGAVPSRQLAPVASALGSTSAPATEPFRDELPVQVDDDDPDTASTVTEAAPSPPVEQDDAGSADDKPTDEPQPQAPALDVASTATKPEPQKSSVRIGYDQLTHKTVYIPFVASPLPKPRVRDRNGLVFIGRSDQIGQVKIQMQQLLKQMGWTANQVLMREATGGEWVSYVLNSAPGDTNTFDLSRQPHLAIAPEAITYVNRKGEKKSLALVSQKEILATMLQTGRAFLFSGPNCRVELLKEQIALRQNVVYWGLRADWVFPEDKLYRYNTADYWQVMKGDDWTLKPGVKASEAIADAFVGKFSYQIGCTSACRFIFAHGIFDFYRAVQPNTAAMTRLAQLLDNQRPFIDIAPTVDRNKVVVKEGRLMERSADVPWNHWVPGDWGWIRNDDDKSAEELGSEGCNIVYAGGGYFVNYYPERPPKTLDQAISRVFGWRSGLEESELELPADITEQLRQDPRSGGMLRDVRDFPRTFGAATPNQPGA